MIAKSVYKILFIVFALFIFSLKQAICQARLIINNGAYLNISNGAFLVIDNGSANAITRNTSGHIISEGENNRVAWTIGTNTGSYTVPFGFSTTDYIPLTFNISSAGVGAGNFIFSTYRTATWDNNASKPTGISQMYLNGTTTNNSAKVLDRFYQIDATTASYSSKPILNSVLLSYADLEHTVATNSITETNLGAQYWTIGTGWLQNLPVGTVNTTGNNVTVTSSIPSLTATKWWTLVEKSSPLPILLNDFKIICENGKTHFNFETSSEKNSNFFEIKVEKEGVQNTLTTLTAQGNSSQKNTYNFFYPDVFSKESLFYLVETDFDGITYTYGPFQYETYCNKMDLNNVSNIHVFPNPASNVLNVNLGNLETTHLKLMVNNSIGQIVYSLKEDFNAVGNIISIPVNDWSEGVYFLSISDKESRLKSFKINITKQ
jgi:hypothetical protein